MVKKGEKSTSMVMNKERERDRPPGIGIAPRSMHCKNPHKPGWIIYARYIRNGMSTVRASFYILSFYEKKKETLRLSTMTILGEIQQIHH